MKIPYNSEKFIEKSILIHRDVYDYSMVEYKKNILPVKIICKHHGVFEQTPHNHLKGRGCKYCANNVKLTTQQFIDKANLIHNKKYDYSLCIYSGNKNLVKIICKKHGMFEVFAGNHLKGINCEKCAIEERAFNQRMSISEFINHSNLSHNYFYNYDKVILTNTKTKVEIICPKHGVFKQKPDHHLYGVGCPKCKTSKGELAIIKFLEYNNIEYVYQKRFHDCKHKSYLYFDFFIPLKNTCIEFDGGQHFYPVKRFGGTKTFVKTQLRDKIKNEYCLKNNIKLIRISDIKEINNILSKEL